ncbi:hypothetical protein [Kribbella sindirgiensis]|uniref:Uncharacterized protein n=1 Tax=Kribbella sindirgiensis TaxID=1124744 RepID=A0A4R0I374_9ACTN|nr:hypothetical protein [Kribbella sindirgiensis]TCC19941.1 hypothetical protein E0H50_37560 [Kribbella sindirgiensis]
MSESRAQERFDALSADTKVEILSQVFQILEYDDEGSPGNDWSSDTTQNLGDLFASYGITFTAPGGEG